MGYMGLIFLWIVLAVLLIAWVYGKSNGNDFGIAEHKIYDISVSHASGFSGPQDYHQKYYYSSCANAEFLEAKLLYQKMGWQVVKKEENAMYFQNPDKASNVVRVSCYSDSTYIDSIPYQACELRELNIIDYSGYNVYMWEDYVPKIKKQYKTYEAAIIRMGDERLRLEMDEWQVVSHMNDECFIKLKKGYHVIRLQATAVKHIVRDERFLPTSLSIYLQLSRDKEKAKRRALANSKKEPKKETKTDEANQLSTEIQYPCDKNIPNEILHCAIAGFSHYDGLKIIKNLNVGEVLELLPEPKNIYDTQAIAVYLPVTENHPRMQLGYIPRIYTAPIHAQIKEGGKDCVYAEVIEINPENNYNEITISVRKKD